MHALKTAIDIAWIIFWVYWLVSAFEVKEGRASRRRIPLNGLTAVSVILVVRVLAAGAWPSTARSWQRSGSPCSRRGSRSRSGLASTSGRNWGMPMTQKAEPELVTSGPYRFVRHPIYSGLLAGMLGTALATNLIGLIIVGILGGYFYYAQRRWRRRTSSRYSPRHIRRIEHARRCSFPSSSSDSRSRRPCGDGGRGRRG